MKTSILENFADSTPHPALGIDFGDARIGVAATDDFGIMAHPVATVANDEISRVLSELGGIITSRKIKTLIVGLPLRLDGSEGDASKKVRAFAKKLSTAIPHLPMYFTDESYTTADASAKLREAGKNAKKQKAIIDKAAAVEILNRWMEESA